MDLYLNQPSFSQFFSSNREDSHLIKTSFPHKETWPLSWAIKPTGNGWRAGVVPCLLGREPWGHRDKCSHTHWWELLLFAVVLWDLWILAHWFSEVGVLGACPLGAGLNFKALDVWSKSFTLQGEARSWGSLPVVWYCVSCGVYGKSVSQPFLHMVSLFHLITWPFSSLESVLLQLDYYSHAFV